MTPLDQALELLRQDKRNPEYQSRFYDLFLNSTFYVPAAGASGGEEAGDPVPLIIDVEGADYLLLFDSEERLRSWAREDAGFVTAPGYVLAATSFPPLHWALNVGTDFSKPFHPEEIAWLRDAVERCRSAAQEK